MLVAVGTVAKGAPSKAKNAGKASGETVFLLAQRSSALGKQIIYVSPGYLRMEAQRVGCRFLVRPPGDTLNIVNDAKRAFYEAPIEDWRESTGSETKALDEIKGKAGKYKESLAGTPLEQANICGLVGYRYTKKVSKDEELDYWLARDITISPAAREVFEKTLGADVPIDRMPLKIISRKSSKGKLKTSVYLETDEFRRDKVSAAIFNTPAGYTRTSNELDVMADLNQHQVDSINSLIYRFSETGELPGKDELKELKSTFLKNK